MVIHERTKVAEQGTQSSINWRKPIRHACLILRAQKFRQSVISLDGSHNLVRLQMCRKRHHTNPDQVRAQASQPASNSWINCVGQDWRNPDSGKGGNIDAFSSVKDRNE
jgi:hypothetical protein